MKQFEAHGMTFFYGYEGVRAGAISLQFTRPGCGSITVPQAALEAFCEQLPGGRVERLKTEIMDLAGACAEMQVRAEGAEAALAERSDADSDVTFLREALANADGRIKALEAHIADADARLRQAAALLGTDFIQKRDSV